MSKKLVVSLSNPLIYLVSFVLVLGLAVSVTYATPLQQDPGPDGIVSVEAEHYDYNVEQSGLRWQETGPKGGFTGTIGMHAPSSGGFSTNYAARSPRLDYEVNFVKTGTHYPWILGWGPDGNSDTCHVGLDGQEIASSDQMRGWENIYTWSNRTRDPERASFEVPSIGVHTLNIWMRESNLIIDKIVLTTNPNYTLTGTEPGPPESPRGAQVVAFDPSPADGATDVPKDVSLSWTPGIYAPAVNGHKVYFSENFNDVNEGIGGITQDANSYTPTQLLVYGQTYYWRVDEVNAPPDYTVYKGDVWQFTVESFAYPIAGASIAATASSQFSESAGPQNTINGSGLDANDMHSIKETDIWLSSMTGPQPTWIQYEFDRVYKLHQLWVWNHNTSIEPALGFGFKDVTIEYSTNGTDWTVLAGVPQFARAPGAPGYAHNTTVDLSDVVAKYVKITANSNWGGIMPQYGLSEVRFFYIPVLAREQNPASGATDMAVDNVTLSWRAGRKAAKHNLYLSTDQQAVINETVSPVSIPAGRSYASYDTGPLNLAQAYYWKVNEVNEAETPTTWQGDIWNFSAQEYLVVDDFEDYNDFEPDRIFDTWIDGWNVPANGSQVGYATPPFAERTIIHGGKQSMPLTYDNSSTANYSEAAANVANLKVGQDWTKYGIKTLSLWFRGDPNNAAERMYVKLNGSKVTYDGDADNITRIGWQPWNIELALFGVNLRNVTELSIGFERSGAVGGKGKVYFDDIRLYSYNRQLITPVEPSKVGLAGYWQFDGNFNDSSGNNRHGAGVGNPAFAAGKVGQAVNLTGSNYVVITGYKGILGGGTFSIAVWVKTGGNGTMVSWGTNVGGQRVDFRLYQGRLRIEHGNGSLQGNTALADGQWHHVALTVSENAPLSYPAVRLYLDGNDDSQTTTDPDTFNIVANIDVNIGRRGTNNDRVFPGSLDEVRIYERALSQEEVAWLAGWTKPFDKPF